MYVKNNNIDGNYNLVATIPVNKESYGTPAVNVSDIKVTVSGSGLRFTPVFSGDVHGGLLKVLRDYKHYYKIEAVRTIKDSDGVETEITAVLGDDDSIWGARQITAKEFATASAISIADSTYDSRYCTVTKWNIGYNRTFEFNNGAKYFLKISGTLYGYATATWNKPRWYGAVCAGIGGEASGGKSSPTTLTLQCNDNEVTMYQGTVTIDSMRDGGGTYTVNYDNQTGDFRSDVSGYFVYN